MFIVLVWLVSLVNGNAPGLNEEDLAAAKILFNNSRAGRQEESKVPSDRGSIAKPTLPRADVHKRWEVIASDVMDKNPEFTGPELSRAIEGLNESSAGKYRWLWKLGRDATSRLARDSISLSKSAPPPSRAQYRKTISETVTELGGTRTDGAIVAEILYRFGKAGFKVKSISGVLNSVCLFRKGNEIQRHKKERKLVYQQVSVKDMLKYRV
jgi:hypothetical protein